MFRSVQIDDHPGCLFLHSMPGRREPIDKFRAELASQRISRIVCLTDDLEIARKSPDYAAALGQEGVGCARDVLPIPNLGVPSDRKAFVELVRDTASRITKGERILVHCGLGIGRTGMFACCVLIELGYPEAKARATVRAAGGYPETGDQDKLIQFVARRLGSTIAADPTS